MKRLPPSIRQKKRYVRFNIHSESNFDLGEVVDCFWDAVIDFSGVQGSSKIDPWIIGNTFDETKQEGVVKVRRSEVESFRAAITLVENIGGEDAFVEVIQVSGSLDKVKRS
ncbi:MAG: ribonuclease P protein component 2 [Nanohaloarchaea archaeon]|nr:ribonuclease P protein component 2 [Candidatus Nanohaloarchaea archaeon]